MKQPKTTSRGSGVEVKGSTISTGALVGGDLVAEQGDIIINPLPEETVANEFTATLCDRTEQDAELKRQVAKCAKERPGAPQVYFLTGHEFEQHLSYVQRFTHFPAILRNYGIATTEKPLLWPSEFPIAGRFEAVFDQMQSSFWLSTDQPDFSASFIKSHPKLGGRTLIICHLIDARTWSDETVRLLEECMQFWHGADNGKPNPQILVFCAISYAPGHTHPVIEKLPRWSLPVLAPSANSIEQRLHGLAVQWAEKYCPVIVLPRMSGIRRQHVSQWATKCVLGPSGRILSRLDQAFFNPDRFWSIVMNRIRSAWTKQGRSIHMLDFETVAAEEVCNFRYED